jgi:hypothetical protein
MKKLTPCPKISKEGLMAALMDGREFTADEGETKIHWDANYGDNPVRCGTKNWNWRGFKYLLEITEQKWYEDPDMVGKPITGVFASGTPWVDLFLSADNSNPVSIQGRLRCYSKARPLTADDLYKGEV